MGLKKISIILVLLLFTMIFVGCKTTEDIVYKTDYLKENGNTKLGYAVYLPSEKITNTGNTYYVSPKGKDTNPGTKDKPWKSPGYASRQLKAGDKLIILYGTYTIKKSDADIMMPTSGTEDNWIIIEGQLDGTKRPKIQGMDNLGAAMDLSDTEYVLIKDLEIRSNKKAPFRSGIIADSASNIVFDNLYIHHIDENAFLFSDVQNVEIRNSLIKYTGSYSIDIEEGAVGNDNIAVSNTDIYYAGRYFNGGNANPYSEVHGALVEASGDVKFLDTRITRSTGSGLMTDVGDLEVNGCKITDNEDTGLQMNGGDATVKNTLISVGKVVTDPGVSVIIDTDKTDSTYTFEKVTIKNTASNQYLMYAQYDNRNTKITLDMDEVFLKSTGTNTKVFISPSVDFTITSPTIRLPNSDVALVIGDNEYTAKQVANGDFSSSGDVGSDDSEGTSSGDDGSSDTGDSGSDDTGSGDDTGTGSGSEDTGSTDTSDSGDTGSGDSGSTGDTGSSGSTGDSGTQPVSPPVVANGNKYYVSKSGSDSNDGSQSKPWATPGHASKQLKAGDTLFIMPGTYVMSAYYDDMLTIEASGNANNWIVIKGVKLDGKRPVLAGRNNLYSGIDIGANDYLWIEGLEVTSNNGANFREGISGEGLNEHIMILDMYIHHVDEFGIDLSDPNYITIENSSIGYTGFGSIGGPDGKFGGWRNVLIRGCDLSYNGHYYQGGPGPSPYDRPDGLGLEESAGPIYVYDTVVEHNRGDGLDSKSSNTHIENCVVANNFADGVKLWHGPSSVKNTLIYGTGDGSNENTAWAAMVLSTDKAHDKFTIDHVTVDFQRSNAYSIYMQYDDPNIPIDLTVKDSIFRSSGSNSRIFFAPSMVLDIKDSVFYYPNSVAVEHGNNEYTSGQISSFGTGNIHADPQFVKPAFGSVGDYNLKAGSPAAGKGAPASVLDMQK